MTAEAVTLETVIRRREAMLSSNLGDDVVMMDIDQGNYYGLEAVGARIWALTEHPQSVGALCQMLTSEYDVAPARCEEEVLTFLRVLLENRVVEVVSA